MAASPSNSSLFILEEKINDLENNLSHKNQILKTKEHVLHLQQEQIKKLEGMYKKALEDLATVNCEHKKTLNDLENLRIILKSYERRITSTRDKSLQIDIDYCIAVKSQTLLSDDQTEELLQQHKTDYFIEALRTATLEQLIKVRNHLENFERTTGNIPYIFNDKYDVPAKRSLTFPLVEEDTINDKVHECNRSISISENYCQTNLLTVESSTNMPASRISSGMQAVIETNNVHSQTDTSVNNSVGIQCECTQYSSVSFQNTLYDEICAIRINLKQLHMEANLSENIIGKFRETISNYQNLVQFTETKEDEIRELQDKVNLLDALLKRNTLLTVDEIKTLCTDSTLQSTEDYKELMQQLNNLREQNEMLRNESDNLKKHHSELSRVIVELFNDGTQTDNSELFISDDYRKQVVKLSEELANAYKSMQSQNNKISQLEDINLSIKGLKEMQQIMNNSLNKFYGDQINEQNVRHTEQVEKKQTEIEDLKKIRKFEMHGITMTVIDDDWSPILEQNSILRIENTELIKVIFDLKQELELFRESVTSAEDLKIMCLKLGQNINENTLINEENIQLKRQLNENTRMYQMELTSYQNHYFHEMQTQLAEIRKLQMDNTELTDGVKQLRMIVEMHTELARAYPDEVKYLPCSALPSTETDTFAHSDATLSNDNASKHTFKDEEISEIDELKCLCKDISRRLKDKKRTQNETEMDLKSHLLTKLEDELKLLVDEFMDFKCSSQTEHQKLIVKHSDILAQNEELINCLNQYKTVNESLLHSHYELEKEKNIAAGQHQVLLEDYLKLQDDAQRICVHSNQDHGTNTLLSAKDIKEMDRISSENVDLQNVNLKLRQEVDNLLRQLKNQHSTDLKKSQNYVNQIICKNCEKLTTENLHLKAAVLQKEEALSACRNKNLELLQESKLCGALQSELNGLKELHQENEIQNTQLLEKVRNLHLQMESANSEKTALSKELNTLNKKQEQLLEELSLSINKSKQNEDELKKYQSELHTLQQVIRDTEAIKAKYSKLEADTHELRRELSKKNLLLKCNDSIQEEYKLLEDQLKAVSDIKEKTEIDFESYIRANNLLQQTIHTQNSNLINEIKELKQTNEILLKDLNGMEDINMASKSELIRVINECDDYKTHLESMTQRLDIQMEEHLLYRTEMEGTYFSLQEEINNLKQMLNHQNMKHANFQSKNFQDKNGVENLKAFIGMKEIEIDYLMGEKLQAMEMMGHLTLTSTSEESSNKNCSTQSTASNAPSMPQDFKVKLNFQKASRDVNKLPCRIMPRASRHRSASVPQPTRTMKTFTPSKETSTQPTQVRKTHSPPFKKK